ncbi:MAG: hypothetical protein ABIG61_13855 [Planctomycetota bacterium]
MQKPAQFQHAALVIILAGALSACAATVSNMETLSGQDLHLLGPKVLVHQAGPDQHVLVFEQGFSMSIGANHLSGDRAVVRLTSLISSHRGTERADYKAEVFLQGNVSVKKGKTAKTTALRENILENGESLLAEFLVTGEVFVTADERKTADPAGLNLYQEYLSALSATQPQPVIQPQAQVPAFEPEPVTVEQALAAPKPGLLEQIFPSKKEVPQPAVEEKAPTYQYPVNIAGVGQTDPNIESTRLSDDSHIATVVGRFYLWQKLDDQGNMLELQADTAVIFYITDQLQMGKAETGEQDLLASGAVQAIYLSGDVIITEGRRTIRADEAYYDFQKRQALAVNSVMRTYDITRGVPIYLRAAKLRQLAQNKFAGENIILTNSEFYMPRVFLGASSVIITDTTNVDEEGKKLSKDRYDVQMRDVKLKLDKTTLFYWPYMRGNFENPDIPIKSAHTSYDSEWGVSVETRWYLAKLLGLREPEGVDSTFALDYFGKRGMGTGAQIQYHSDNYFGNVLGYGMRDTGEDDLGRSSFRKDIDPPRKTRGRFRFQHRHFLPYDWQLTLETSYASDQHFIEGFYRNEFDVGKEQETIVHLKRIRDNWGLSILGKWRINNFVDKLQELPTLEYHRTGQSLFDDKFTLYSDSQISRYKQRFANNSTLMISEEFFTFAFNRTELDLPIKLGVSKVIPYIAGTFGYDDRSGFARGLVDGSGTGTFGEKEVWVGELGLRASTQLLKLYPDIKSKLWDVDGIKHIIRPSILAVMFEESDDVVKQRNLVNLSLLQRWQTKRGPADARRTVDWMRLFTGVTLVSDDAGASAGPDKLLWSSPFTPMKHFSTPTFFNNDLITGLPTVETFGVRRDSFDAEYVWRISDTTAVLSDLNYDIQSGVVQQYDIGFSRLVWPNLSYYIGSRYLKRINVLGEKGANPVTVSLSYQINPRYSISLANTYDFDYSDLIETEINLIRKYNRVFYALTFLDDETRERQSIVFSIWAEGVSDIGFGPVRHARLVGSTVNY